MRILVLGGYGLIGLAVTRRLLAAGHEVVGLGRSPETGRRFCPQAEWVGADLRRLTAPQDWLPFLGGIAAVVNAAGVLQSGGRDDVSLIQEKAVCALVSACKGAGVERFVQISAPGVSTQASTEFYRSKAVADEALKASSLDWTILRPGLVLSPQAYGGTSLLRMLAAVPLIQPLTLPDARVQTVHVDDVSEAVLTAIRGEALRVEADLVEVESRPLEDVVLAIRQWLGFAPPFGVLRLPGWLGRFMARGADIAGLLGWRSPLRTTALNVLEEGVVGDPEIWRRQTGQQPKALSETLLVLPSTIQERLYARMSLLFPVLLVIFSVFWFASGGIGLFRVNDAIEVIEGDIPAGMAKLFVLLGSFADMAIGAAVLFRRTYRPALLASLLVCVGYLAGATFFVPHLWTDPLGPLVKVFPAMTLSFTLLAMGDKR